MISPLEVHLCRYLGLITASQQGNRLSTNGQPRSFRIILTMSLVLLSGIEYVFPLLCAAYLLKNAREMTKAIA
jgi:hypothetical protein